MGNKCIAEPRSARPEVSPAGFRRTGFGGTHTPPTLGYNMRIVIFMEISKVPNFLQKYVRF